MKGLWFILFFFFSAIARGQNPLADFGLLTNACLEQNILIQNQSTNTTRYEWDLCQGDLTLTPFGSKVGVITGTNTPTGMDVVYDGSNWYCFVASRNDNSIFRLSLGKDLDDFGAITNLGNIDSNLNHPLDIKIVADNNKWYGFVYNESANLITRLDFGSSLTNIPTATPILTGSTGTFNQGLDVIRQGATWFVAYSLNSQVGILRLNSIEDVPDVSNQLLTNSLSGSPALGDVKILMDENNLFFLYAVSWSSPILYKLAFGNDLFSQPVESDYSSVLNSSYSHYGINGGFDAGTFQLFLTTLQGAVFRIDVGTDLTQAPPVSQQTGGLAIFGGTTKNCLVKNESAWSIFSINYGDGSLYRGSFPNPSNCEFPTVIKNKNPQVSFAASGTKYVTLRAFNNKGTYDEKSQSITISSLTSPDITTSIQNNCVNNNVNFSSTNQSGDINSYQWKFGDNATSNSANPSHIYSTASTYYPSLTVTASNSCQNFLQDTLQIFNSPQANFNLPSASPICSNQNYVFTNTSTYDNGSSPTWQWSVNGINVANTQDLNYLIPTTVAQNIVLTASIPGCSSQSTQSIPTVQDGPLVNFNSPAAGCVNSSVTFTNTSTGTITSFSWNFGDGNTSSQANGSNSYASSGNFSVTLSASNTAGCQNYLTKNFPVYSNPQPDFAIEAPPYSCANYPAQFDNNTPALTDSNITSWAWSFGDAANGTSNQKNPSYTFSTASTYNVSLKATSNFGCNATKQRSITIYPSTQSGFTNTPACVDQNTIFTDASTGNITSYQWLIQGTTFTGINPPPYVFKSAGTYPVSLTTTSGNGCKNQILKNIVVPIPPVMEFTVQSPCVGKPTTFQETNPGGLDPSVVWNWNFGPGSGVGSPVNYSFETPSVYLVTLSTTRNSGCVYSTSKNVSIYNGPIAKFTPSTQSGAPPLAVTFNNESTADSYLWQFGYNNATSTEFSPTYTYNELGEYKVLLTANNIHGCSDTTSTKIYVVIPRVDLAMKNFSLVENPNSSNSSNPVVTISNLGNIPLTNPEVQIDLGGNAVLKEKIDATILPGKTVQQILNLAIVPQMLGYICAEVSPEADINIYNGRQCLSVTNDDVLFYPYPNPAKGQINFDWISAESENVAVTIFKSNGQVVFRQDFQMAQSGINQLAIDISSLSSGLYLVQFSGAKVKKAFSVSVIN